MVIISEKKHVSTIISSINKVYNRSKVDGKLSVKDIYYLHVIYKLLSNNLFNLTLSENNLLISTYNRLTYLSKNICPPIMLKTYQTTPKVVFEQAEVKDCNTLNSYPRIFYWQETFENNNLEIIDLVNLEYIDDKPNDTYESFATGKDITYSIIGKICFFMLDSKQYENFVIKDNLGNNVTHTFDKYYNSLLRGNLYISQNIYAHGNLFFKINRQTQESGIFNNSFNNVFI